MTSSDWLNEAFKEDAQQRERYPRIPADEAVPYWYEGQQIGDPTWNHGLGTISWIALSLHGAQIPENAPEFVACEDLGPLLVKDGQTPLNAAALKWIMTPGNERYIPEQWKDGQYRVFAGTVYGNQWVLKARYDANASSWECTPMTGTVTKENIKRAVVIDVLP